MAQGIEGRWPWENGKMARRPVAAPEDRAEPPVPFYMLPTVGDRRAEGGRRPATARELARMKRARETGENGYFEW